MRDSLSRFFKRHPWAAVLLLVVVFVVTAVVDGWRLRHTRSLLTPGTFDTDVEIGIGIAVALIVIGVLVITGRVRGLARRILGVIGFSAWVVAVAWVHPRYGHKSVSSSPDVVMTVAGDLPLLAFGVALLFVRASGRTWRPAARAGPAVSSHTAEVWYVVDNQKRPTFDPYYIAHCSCDWTGTARTGSGAEHQAFDDARSHAPDVTPSVQRPLG